MRVLAGFLCLFTASVMGSPPVHPAAPPPDRPHALAAEAANQTPAHCTNIKDEVQCHKLAAGCGTSQHPGYDAYLAFFKNQTITPLSADGQIRRTFTKLSDFVALDVAAQKLFLATKHQSAFATKLADIGEVNNATARVCLYYYTHNGKAASNLH